MGFPRMEGAAKLQDARVEKGEKRVALRDISKESNVLRDTPRLVGAKGEHVSIFSLLFFFFFPLPTRILVNS